MKRPTHKLLICLTFLISTAVIVLNRVTPLYINSSIVHFFFFFLSVGSLAVIIVDYLLGFNSVKAISVTLAIALVGCLLKAFLTWGGEWKTQTVLYQNRKHDSKTIELQMRGDRFAFGYRKQVIVRERLIPFFDIITHVDTSKVDASAWQRVDKYVNELNLPAASADSPNQ